MSPNRFCWEKGLAEGKWKKGGPSCRKPFVQNKGEVHEQNQTDSDLASRCCADIPCRFVLFFGKGGSR